MKNIDLKTFCDPEASRYSLEAPFVIDGKEYATDGRVCVEIAASGKPDTGSERRLPSQYVPEMFAKFPRRFNGKAWPKANYDAVHKTCKHCKHVATVKIAGNQQVASRQILKESDAKIRTLKGLKYQCGKIKGVGNVVFFTFDGGRGVVAAVG